VPVAGAAAAIALAAVTAAPAGVARDATAGATASIVVEISVEKIQHAGGPTDVQFPFEPVQAGDGVYLRVTARHDGGPPLPARQAQIRVLLPDAAGSSVVVVVGHQGVRRCTRIEGTIVSCPITRKLRDGDAASVLLRVTVPSGLGAEALRFTASAASLAGADVRVRAKPQSISVAVADPAPWKGRWTWKATWDTGSFTGRGMRIYQPAGGSVVCAEWDWSGGGSAWGTVSGNTWSAQWADGYGSGRWTLTLELGELRFTGTQNVTAHSSTADSFVAAIVGEQTDDAAVRLDCDEIDEDLTFDGFRR
jgi:hypothetical protein